MERDDVRLLEHITHIDNLASIKLHGICCHNTARHFRARDVFADPAVMGRRERTVPGSGLALKDYAALYFNAKNPMLSTLRDRDGLAVLRIATEVLDSDGTMVTNGNAAARDTRVDRAPAMLRQLDPELVYARAWRGNPPAKAATMSEVLVEEFVPAALIVGACGASASDRARILEAFPGLPVEVDPWYFYRGGSP